MVETLPRRRGIDPNRLTGGVHVGVLARYPIGELQGRVSERVRERVAQRSAATTLTELGQERADRVGFAEPGPQEAHQEGKR